MDEISDGVIALAGGFLNVRRTFGNDCAKTARYNKKPIVILNTNGFYDKAFGLFEVIIEEKFAK